MPRSRTSRNRPPAQTNDSRLRVLDSSALSEAVVLRMDSDDLQGVLWARTADRRTPDQPDASLGASFIVCGDYHVRQPLRFLPHAHPSFELNLLLSGSWRCRFQDSDLILEAGDAVLAQPGELHEDRVAAGSRYRGLRFALHHLGHVSQAQPLLRPGAPAQLRLLRGVEAMFLPTLDRLHEAHHLDNHTTTLVQDALVLELAWRIAGRLPFAELHPHLGDFGRHRHFRLEMLAWFQEHAQAPIAISVMATDLGVSERTLRDRCLACFGLAPARAFMHYRLSLARRMLCEPGATVARVSQSMGFRNPFHFSRAFRQHFGHPPSRDGG